MTIKRKLLLSQHGDEQGHLLRNGKKLKCKKCGFECFNFLDNPTCVRCSEPVGMKIMKEGSLRDNKKEKFIKMLIDDPLKHASDFVEIFLQSDEAKHLLRDAGFGCTGMPIIETVQEAVDEINRLRG